MLTVHKVINECAKSRRPFSRDTHLHGLVHMDKLRDTLWLNLGKEVTSTDVAKMTTVSDVEIFIEEKTEEGKKAVKSVKPSSQHRFRYIKADL